MADLTEPRLRVLSLGAGVQSTTMALLAARGLIGPMPDAAIFSDTGDEPAATYAHLAWLSTPGVLPFPIHTTGRGSLSESVLAGVKEARPPLFVRNVKGGVGMLGRQCTRNYKLRPIRSKTRELLGVGSRAYVAPGTVEAWVGISKDEIIRARPSGLRYIINRHPLLEAGFSRMDCLGWLKHEGYPTPPKSSCWHCPYRSDDQWRDMRDNQPGEFAKAVAFDEAIRSPAMVALYGAASFVHSSCEPLGEIDLNALPVLQMEMFDHECEGMCGV